MGISISKGSISENNDEFISKRVSDLITSLKDRVFSPTPFASNADRISYAISGLLTLNSLAINEEIVLIDFKSLSK
jgi:hypothetical protein